ncbi:MAG: AAA family ATPase [Desulfobacterales bacterium]|jgi:class 3 adenylate cyclase/tetratricopeptide (TPR) repeat protein|nr:AAA family ATPase [Desulfobacteraceae bacterium]MBT4365611.1 AAA family ATPase [Desulfobacteraceae bacterium]MBT7086506.1 AAA family ATPase [Desulfobacterales bacterium]MBT7697100.1 AAA family ATPase [Desulfobacterales bacterium]
MKNGIEYREAERRMVTVLFADISGFTAMSEKLDPEEVGTLMNNCYLMMDDVFEKYGATVDKYIGDCVMVTFGAPNAVENAPQKAINTAIEIRNKLQQFNRMNTFSIPLNIHIGVNTGPVFAGKIGGKVKKEYTVIGDAVNIASRLESVSEPGQILVGQSTFHSTEDFFKYKKTKPLELKGKTEQIDVYELLSVKEIKNISTSGFTGMIHSKIVGRDKELNILKNNLKRVIAGDGNIVNIIGEAGIGKSRLLSEIKNFNIAGKVVFREGRGVAMGKNLGFHPFVDLMRSWAGIKEQDTEIFAFRKLEETIKDIYPENIDDILPYISILLGIKLTDKYEERMSHIDVNAKKTLILSSVRELLLYASLQKPLVIIMEDLHWADNSSIELLETIFRLVETHRILFVNLFRPGYNHSSDHIVNTVGERYYECSTQINLFPLDEIESRDLVNNFLDVHSLPHKIRENILLKAGGNPFFIEEVVRSLIDVGAVLSKNGTYQTTNLINSVVIPHTINDVLMSRIDHLDEKTRNLVMIASVIGRNFFHRILVEAIKSSSDIDSSLKYLKEIQFIFKQNRMDEVEYIFKHALAQEVAYESILHQKKKELHLVTASAIEKIFHDRIHDFYGMLAYHYSCGNDPDKTEEYMLKAGDEALMAAASSEAFTFYKQALKIYLNKYGNVADSSKIAKIEENIALALYNKGKHIESIKYFEKALSYNGIYTPENKLLLKLKFLHAFLSVLLSLYLPSTKWKKTPKEVDNRIINLYYNKAAAMMNTLPERFFYEAFFFSRKLSVFNLNKIEGGVGMFVGVSVALSWYGIFFSLSKKIIDFVKVRANSHDDRSILFIEVAELLPDFYKGKWEKSFDEKFVETSLKTGEIMHVSAYVSFHGRIMIEQGDYKGAMNLLSVLSEIAGIYEHEFTNVLKHILNIKLHFKYREFENIIEETNNAIEYIKTTDFRQALVVMYSLKARIYTFKGDLENAEKTLKNAFELKNELRVISDYKNYLQLSQLDFDIKKYKTIKESGNRNEIVYRKKRALLSGKKMIKKLRKSSSDRTEVYRLMGSFFWYQGKQNKAIDFWVKSIDEGEELKARLEVSRTYMEIWRCLSKPESMYEKVKDISFKDYLFKARELFEEMNLKNDINIFQRVTDYYNMY